MSIALSQHTTTPADWQPAAQQTLRLAGLPESWRADVGIVLGSGLGAAAEHIAEGDSCELRMGKFQASQLRTWPDIVVAGCSLAAGGIE